MKTWACLIYGAGTPLYLVSAESEKRAWELIKEDMYKKYNKMGYINPKKDTSGLHYMPLWNSLIEQCIDIYDIYSKDGTIIKGSFKDC